MGNRILAAAERDVPKGKKIVYLTGTVRVGFAVSLTVDSDADLDQILRSEQASLDTGPQDAPGAWPYVARAEADVDGIGDDVTVLVNDCGDVWPLRFGDGADVRVDRIVPAQEWRRERRVQKSPHFQDDPPKRRRRKP